MQPFLAMIMPVSSGPVDPGWSGGVAPPGQEGGAPRPDQGLPGGGWTPGAHPSHPIWRPDLGFWGGSSPGTPPSGGTGIWGGPFQPPYPSQGPGFPTAPIVIPPDLPETLPDPDNRPIDWKTAWTPSTGWVVVGIPQGPVPTPSK